MAKVCRNRLRVAGRPNFSQIVHVWWQRRWWCSFELMLICLFEVLQTAVTLPDAGAQNLQGYTPVAGDHMADPHWLGSGPLPALADRKLQHLEISFKLVNQNEMDQMRSQMQDPSSPLYGHYLTRQQFLANFRCKIHFPGMVVRPRRWSCQAGLSQVGGVVISTQRLLLTTPHPTQRLIPSMPR